jgi:hypothetical protein
MYKRKKSRSAMAKARNLRPKNELKSASAKSFLQERESASMKPKKKRMPSSGYGHLDTRLVAPSPLKETSRVQGFLKQL